MQFATPSLVAMSANSIYNLCDAIFIGQGAGPMAIAGLAITFPMMNISSAFGAMLGVGSASQTSVAMGGNDARRGQLILGNMLRFDITIALILTFIGLTFLTPILRLFGASDATLPFARDYMQIILAGCVVTHTFLGLCDQLRASGNPNRSMRAHLTAIISNIILDPIFIFGFGWGIKGAAIATLCGQLIGLCYAVRFFFDKKNFSHFSAEGFKLDLSIIKDIVTIGLSPFLINVSNCIIVVILNRALMSCGGADGDFYVGVYGICNRLNLLLIMMISGFSQGMQPIVGFNLGAKKYDRVFGVLRFTYICVTILMIIGYGIVCIIPGPIASLFTADGHMISMSVPALRIMLCALPLTAGQIITTTFFTSVQKPKAAIWLSLTRQVILLLPLLLILPPTFGVNGVWASIPISETGSAILAMILLNKEIKKQRSVLKQ